MSEITIKISKTQKMTLNEIKNFKNELKKLADGLKKTMRVIDNHEYAVAFEEVH